MRKLSFFLCSALVVSLLAPTVLIGQTETGQIVGTVTDPSGAVVPNAKVTVKSVATQAERKSVSSKDGVFIVTNLLPATYTVRIEAPGFATAEKQVTVTVGSRVGVDIALEVGTSSTVVEVSGAAAVAVNTETQTLSQVIDTKSLTELPTLTRNPYDLVATSGNVSSTADAGWVARGAGYSINGQRDDSTNILLDGASNNDEFTGSVGQAVPLDSVQEFSILTNNFTAEFGRASGGVVNVAIKSGTNQLHGTGYEFNRVSDLAANTFENNSNGIEKPVFTRNQFGYSVGGPIKKDKLFFFNSTEWTRVRSAANTTVMYPTDQLISAADPATQAFFANAKLRSSLVPLGTVTKNDYFAANAVDMCSDGAVDGPCASLPGDLPIFNKASYSVPSDSGGGYPQNTYSLVGRVDYNLSDHTQFYGRYAIENELFSSGSVSQSVYAGYDTGEDVRNQNMLFSITHTFSPRLVSQSKIVFNRLKDVQPLGTTGNVPTLYFYKNSAATILGSTVAFPGYLPYNPGSSIPFGGPQNYVQLYEDISYMAGKHQLRFGGSYDYIRDNRTFGAYETAVEVLGSGLGEGLDNFLSSQLKEFDVAVNPQGHYPCVDPANPTPQCEVTLPVTAPNFSRSNRYNEFAVYAQDSWRMTPRFTVNLGLRWELFGTPHNKDPRLDSNFYDGSGGSVQEQMRNGSVSIAPNSPIHALWATDWNNLAPRLGFAWDVTGNGKTSLRGGYGIGYERNMGNITFNMIQNPPNYAVLALTNASQTVPLTVNNFGPLSGSVGTAPLPNVSLRAVDPHIRTAYAHLWSLSVEHEIAPDTVLELDYSGSKGDKLYSVEYNNRPGDGNVYLGDPYDSSLLNPDGSNPFSEASMAALTLLKTSQYSYINRRENDGLSFYNSLNTKLTVRNVKKTGLSLVANYTWAHSLDNLSSSFSESYNNLNLGVFDPYNPKIDRGHSDFDVRHRLVVSGTWDVPFARNTTGLAKGFLDGWTAAPIFTARTGTPFTLYDSTWSYTDAPRAAFHSNRPAARPSSVTEVGANTYDYIDLSSATLDQTWNPIVGLSDFAPYPSSMIARNYFRGPGAWNMNFGLYKTTKINERLSLQIRAEAYNLFNHSNLYFVTSDNNVAYIGFVSAKKGYPPAVADERRNVQIAMKLIF